MDWRDLSFCVETDDGGVAIYVPAPSFKGSKEEWKKKNNLHKAEKVVELNPITFPATRKYRGAWKISGERIVLDYQKAKKIYKDRKNLDKALP